jgi:hypothetical protein
MAKTNVEESGPFIGMIGLVVALFLYGYSAIALPSWLHSLVMPLAWLVLFVLGAAWFTKHPYRMLVLPVIAIVLWFALMLGFGPHA